MRARRVSGTFDSCIMVNESALRAPFRGQNVTVYLNDYLDMLEAS